MQNKTNNKKLKIAMVIDVYDSKGGGIVSTKRFTELLREKGHKVVLISTGWPDKDKLVLKEFYLPFVEDIMRKMKMVFAKPDEEKIKSVLRNSDIVHCQLPFYLGIKTITLAQELNVPVITTFHVQAENITKNLNIESKRIIKIIYKFFIKRFYNRSDLVICPSLFAKQELVKFGLKARNVVISNGYTTDYYSQRLRRKIRDKFVVLTVGRLAAEKNQKIIIDALALSKYKKDIQLVMIGNGPLLNELKRKGRILLNRPKILTHLSDKQKIEWYNCSDLYVHGGEVELEGMTVLEAMACGLPPVILDSNKSASKQFALSKKSLFKNAKDLAEKIDFWYEHPSELLKTKDQYLEVSKKYAIQKSVIQLENAYNSAIKIHRTNHRVKKDNEDNSTSWYNFLKYFYKRDKIKN